MANCVHCGATVADDAVICMSCGCYAKGDAPVASVAMPTSAPNKSKKWLLPVILGGIALVAVVVLLITVVLPASKKLNVMDQLVGNTFVFEEGGVYPTEKCLKFESEYSVVENWHTEYTYSPDSYFEFSWTYTLEKQNGEYYVVISDIDKYRVEMDGNKIKALVDTDSNEWYKPD